MPVRARVILGPKRQTLTKIAVEASTIPVIGTRRKHQPGEGKLGLFLPIRRELEMRVLNTGVLPEWLLEGVQCTHERKAASPPPERFSGAHRPGTHRSTFFRSISLAHHCRAEAYVTPLRLHARR